MKRFQLFRNEDPGGVSGTGIVAEGVQFESGKCVLSWLTQHTSLAVYDNIETLEKIHGHGGRTVIRWVDEEPLRTPQPAPAQKPVWDNSTVARLRAALVRAYSSTPMIEQFCEKVGVEKARINFQDSLEGVWYQVLNEARKLGKLDVCQALFRSEYRDLAWFYNF